ncbi:hypothetical protein [Sphingomonas dokdonensis]|uniref:Uncharacterized protein n=1 Tax=Sphingomonas dokdonensis TaxID=344880 RepID=A0A245ZK17_9SPHN|nr:hypothetical protein [Sphingomonas dokdonensis]OWK30092.1 hypothetical protein SPDO_17730 [Sphingomonas dokdonensis]
MTEEQAMSGKAIYEVFFEHGEVRSDFKKEFISLWPGWLGKERLHLLDEVSEDKWLRFNRMLLAAFGAFHMGVVDHSNETIKFPARLEPFLSDHQEAMQKDASQFLQFVIPAMNCVITEDWDYTYILWHRDVDTLEAIKPLLSGARLEHFSD